MENREEAKLAGSKQQLWSASRKTISHQRSGIQLNTRNAIRTQARIEFPEQGQKVGRESQEQVRRTGSGAAALGCLQGLGPTSQKTDHFSHLPFYLHQSSSSLSEKTQRNYQEHPEAVWPNLASAEPVPEEHCVSLDSRLPSSQTPAVHPVFWKGTCAAPAPRPFAVSTYLFSPLEVKAENLNRLHLAYWHYLLVCTADLIYDKYVEHVNLLLCGMVGVRGWVLPCVLEQRVELLSMFFTGGIIQFPVWFQRNRKIKPEKNHTNKHLEEPKPSSFPGESQVTAWKWTQYFQGRKSEPSLLALPLPHPLFLSPLPSSFLFSSALQLPTTIGKEERPVLNQHSTPYKIQQNPLKNGFEWMLPHPALCFSKGSSFW